MLRKMLVMTKSSPIVAIIGVVTCAIQCWSALRASPPISLLEKASDVVLVARISAKTAAAPSAPNDGRVLVVLEPLRAIRLPASGGKSEWTVSWSPGAAIPTVVLSGQFGRCGLFFLKQINLDDFTLLSFQTPAKSWENIHIPVPCGAIPQDYAYLDSASTADKIVAELAAAYEEWAGREPLLSFIQHGMVDRLSPGSLARSYRHLAASTSVDQRTLGLAGLLRQDDVSALLEAERDWATLSKSREYVWIPFAVEGFFRNTSPGAITILGRISLSAGVERRLRFGSARALANMHTKETLPHLVSLMDDTDPEIQSLGTGGLAMFANNVGMEKGDRASNSQFLPGPAPWRTDGTIEHGARGTPFLANPAKYLSFWRSWWAQNRAKLVAP